MLKTTAVWIVAVALVSSVGAFALPAVAWAAPLCTNPPRGVLQDWSGGTDAYLVTYTMNTVHIKNTSPTCAYKVGVASYKAYQPYSESVFSQTYFASRTTLLQPGQKWSAAVPIPACTYQIDAYWGDVISQFQKPNLTYSGQGRLLDGWYFPGNLSQQGQLPTCLKPTTVPTHKPTPIPTPVHTPTPSALPSQVLGVSTTPTPPTQLPTTGPGGVVIIAICAPLAALLLRKYYLVVR